MAHKFRRRTPFHPALPEVPEDALYHALVGRVVTALGGYSDLRKAVALALDALRRDPENTHLQAEAAHITCQLAEGRGRALSYVDAFTLTFPDRSPEDHAAIRTAVQLAGLDAPLPSAEDAVRLAVDFLTGGDAS